LGGRLGGVALLIVCAIAFLWPSAARALTPTTTVVTSSFNPSVVGQSVTFTATVTGAAGTPTGTVQFLDNGTPIGGATLVAGTASFTTSTLAVGSHSITAVYSGDSTFATSIGSVPSQTVNKDNTTTTVTSSANPGVFGQTFTFTATVAAASPGGGTPTGSVTFFVDGVPQLPTATLSGGVATLTSTSLTVGNHIVTATYNGDTNFIGSSGSLPIQVVNKANTTTALTSSANPSEKGQSVTFTATVTAASPGAGTPTGAVTFVIDGAPNTATLSGGGVASFTTSTLGIGNHSVTASYGGDPNFSASTSAPLSQGVNVAATRTTLASSPNPSASGQLVTFTATVAPSAGPGTPTGTVTFKDGASALGTGTLAAGVASFATSSLAVGGHSITAVYNGDTNFGGSTSAALSQAVNTPADSLKLRALQLQVTKIEAQSSGDATSSAIDGAVSDGFSESSPLISGSDNGVHLNFAGEQPLQEKKQTFDERAGDAFAALGYAGPPLLVKAPPPAPKEWLVWADIHGTNWSTNLQTGDIRGGQTNGFVGVTRKLSSDLLIGAFAGAETFDYTSQLLNGRLKGDGWSTGAYLGWRILPGLRFEAGGSYSGIGYDGTSGAATGTFPGQRWLTTAALVGTTKLRSGFDVENSARIYALWEHEPAYTDSLGTPQPQRNFSSGRASAGSKVSYPWPWSSTVTLIPYVGAYADYYFNSDDAVLPNASPLLLPTQFVQGWSGRLTSGVGVKTKSGAQFLIGGEVGGLGSNQFTTWTAHGRVSVPF
jgi:hypothetical protein